MVWCTKSRSRLFIYFPKLEIGMLYHMSNIYRRNHLKISVPESLSAKFSGLFRRYLCFKCMHFLTRHTIMTQWLYCGLIVNVEGKIVTVFNETQVFHDQPESIGFRNYSTFRGAFGTLRTSETKLSADIFNGFGTLTVFAKSHLRFLTGFWINLWYP